MSDVDRSEYSVASTCSQLYQGPFTVRVEVFRSNSKNPLSLSLLPFRFLSPSVTSSLQSARIFRCQVVVAHSRFRTTLVGVVLAAAAISVAAAVAGLTTLGEGATVGAARGGLPGLGIKAVNGLADTAEREDDLFCSC